MARSPMTEAQAARAVRQTDKYRADYHRYYTGEKWTDPIHYDLCLNSSRIGWDACAEVIKHTVSEKLGIPYAELVQALDHAE